MSKPKKPAQAKPEKIADTRFDDELGKKLRWHFTSSASDSGYRSSFGPMTDMALSGPPTGGGARRAPDAHVNDRWSKVMNAHRRIHEALKQLTPEHRDALTYAYGEERFPMEAYAKFPALGLCAGAVMLSAIAKAAFAHEVEQRRTNGQPCVRNGKPITLVEFASLGVGEWLRTGAPTSVKAEAVAETMTRLDAARKAFVALHGGIREEAKQMRKAALRRAAEPIARFELRKRTELAC